MPRRRAAAAALLDRRLDRRPQVVRPQVEQDEPGIELRELEQVLGQPVEPLDLLAARLEELGARLGVVGGALLEQLVERAQRRQRRPQLVRDVGQEVAAPVAVAADDLDALLEPVGHGVELDGELGHLGRPGPDLVGRDARLRSPSARPREASVRRRSGVVNRRAMAADTSTLSPSANRATAASRPVTLASAVARKVYGLDSVTSTAYGLNRSPPPDSPGCTETFFSCVWPTCGERLEVDLDRVPVGRHEGLALAARARTGRT